MCRRPLLDIREKGEHVTILSRQVNIESHLWYKVRVWEIERVSH